MERLVRIFLLSFWFLTFCTNHILLLPFWFLTFCINYILLLPFWFLTFCINHILTRPTTKQSSTRMFSYKPHSFSEKLKMEPTIFPTIDGSPSTAFYASRLRGSDSLVIYFFKVLLSFGGEGNCKYDRNEL